jgi:hypothetical protein
MNPYIRESAGLGIAASLLLAGAAYTGTRPFSAFEAVNRGHAESACLQKHTRTDSLRQNLVILTPTADIVENCRQRSEKALRRESASLRNTILSWLGGLSGVLFFSALAIYADGRKPAAGPGADPS